VVYCVNLFTVYNNVPVQIQYCYKCSYISIINLMLCRHIHICSINTLCPIRYVYFARKKQVNLLLIDIYRHLFLRLSISFVCDYQHFELLKIDHDSRRLYTLSFINYYMKFSHILFNFQSNIFTV